MLTLAYCPGACSMAPHFVLEDSGEKYVARKIDCAGGEQYTEEYKKNVNPHSRVPVLQIDSGDWISENIAILPYLGKRFGFWTDDPVTEAKMLSFIGWVASTVHPAQAHYRRAYRYATDKATHPNIQFSLVSPGVVRTEFGINAMHGGPDSRTLPESQSAEEVAEVIADVIESRAPDVYTRPGAKGRIAGYYANVGQDP